jgi:hypothetical protein
MSKRVYEIARERSLETKEVMDRLRDAGVEVKNHFAVVDDPVVDGVFGDGQSTQTDFPVEAGVAGEAGNRPPRLPRLPPSGGNPVRAGASGAGS